MSKSVPNSKSKKNEVVIFSHSTLEISKGAKIVRRESIKVSEKNGIVASFSCAKRDEKLIHELVLITIRLNGLIEVEIKKNKEPVKIKTKTDNFESTTMQKKTSSEVLTALKKYKLSELFQSKIKNSTSIKISDYL